MKKPSFFHFFWSVHKHHRPAVWGFVFLSMCIGVHPVFAAYLTKSLIDGMVEFSGWSGILTPSVIFLLVTEGYNFCWRGINLLRMWVVPVVKARVIDVLFDHVHSQAFPFFENTHTGSTSNNILQMAENVERIGSRSSVQLISAVVQVGAALVGLAIVHPIFAGMLLLWSLVFSMISFVFSKRVRDLSNSYAMSQSEVSGLIVDSVSNFTNVSDFNGSPFERKGLRGLLSRQVKRFRARDGFLIKVNSIQGVSITALIGASLYLLGKMRFASAVSVGDFAFILGVIGHVTTTVWKFSEHIDQFNDAVGKCNQSLNVLFLGERMKEGSDELIPGDGRLVFEEVTFSYPGREPLFLNETFVIQGGEKVGLVGSSGSGKTTFANLLLRHYDIEEGRILIDGVDITKVTLKSLRESIAIIPQNPILFHRSVMENIRYGRKEATDKEVVEAAKKAQIHDFIVNLPLEYNTLSGEQGIKLSGGQRQRIAIARAILKDAPILVMDEATSNLDSVTEHEVRKDLFAAMDGRTSVFIAHRLTSLKYLDRILVFEDGKIIENGTHEELLTRDGVYRALWESQVGTVEVKG